MRPDMTYDAEADALYVRLSDARPHEGADAAPGVTLHYDKEGKIVGIEVLDASNVLAAGGWSGREHRKPAHAAE